LNKNKKALINIINKYKKKIKLQSSWVIKKINDEKVHGK